MKSLTGVWSARVRLRAVGLVIASLFAVIALPGSGNAMEMKMTGYDDPQGSAIARSAVVYITIPPNACGAESGAMAPGIWLETAAGVAEAGACVVVVWVVAGAGGALVPLAPLKAGDESALLPDDPQPAKPRRTLTANVETTNFERNMVQPLAGSGVVLLFIQRYGN